MTLVLLVYLIGVLPMFSTMLVSMGIVLILILAICILVFSLQTEDADGEDKEKWRTLNRKSFKCFWIPPFLFLVACLIPSERTMYTMLTVYGAAEIAKTPAAQQIGNDAVDVIKELVAKARRELSEENKKAEK